MGEPTPRNILELTNSMEYFNNRNNFIIKLEMGITMEPNGDELLLILAMDLRGPDEGWENWETIKFEPALRQYVAENIDLIERCLKQHEKKIVEEVISIFSMGDPESVSAGVTRALKLQAFEEIARYRHSESWR